MIFVRTLFDQLPYPKSNLFALFCTANLIRFGSLAFTFTFTKSYSFFCPLINSCFLLQFFSAVFVYILCLLLYILVYGNVWLGFVFSFENISNFLLNVFFFQYSSSECFICSRFNSKFKLILTPSEGFILIAFPRLTYSKLSLSKALMQCFSNRVSRHICVSPKFSKVSPKIQFQPSHIKSCYYIIFLTKPWAIICLLL